MKDVVHGKAIGLLATGTLLLFAAFGCSESSADGSVSGAGDIGDACASDADCSDGMLCGTNNGACFQGARSERRCWAARCQGLIEPAAGDCGQAGSPCGPVCDCATACNSSNQPACPPGEECIPNFGRVLGIESRDACGDASRCPSNDPALCGAVFSLCGPICICTPDCSQATPSNPGDGCGGLCPDVCPIGLKGCCTQDFECADGGLCLLDTDGAPTCRPRECLAEQVPPLCGTPDALCGECPICTPRCEGRTCGPDPNCGMSCGACGDSASCDSRNCQPCGFELELQGTLVEPRVSNEELPTPEGIALISDDTFDLTDIVVYGQVEEPPLARREALRFFDSGNRAEYVVEVPGDTTELPRRIMSVMTTTSFTELSFRKNCPSEWEETSTPFVRGYTVTETGLLLFDASTVFVFTRR